MDEFLMGDVLKLRKPHPCGGFDWEVTRLGADIGLRCLTCSHRVLLARDKLRKSMKSYVSRGEPVDPEKERLIFERNG
jgi:hypothetical protein